MRFQTCMMNKEFANGVRNSENGHLLLKMLRERIVDELGLTSETKEEDLTFKQMRER